MPLADDLIRVAETVGAHGPVAGVLAAEPRGNRRVYLVAFEGEPPEWLAVDDGGAPLLRRDLVREAASIVAMCEVAADTAGGGDLEQLRAELARLRMAEQPPGIDEAEDAALALERTIGAAPRVASPRYLDAVGVATMELERALGEARSPFAEALRAANGAVEEFVRDVERRYKLPLE